MAIYVGNIAYSVNEQDLESLFSEYGEVRSVKIIKDRDTGKSKGFAFVEMNDEQNEDSAIDSLNGRDVKGRALKMNKAKPREARESRERRY